MQHLSSFNRALDDCSSQDKITIDYILVRYGELGAEIFVVLEFAGRSKEVEEAAEEMDVFSCEAGDEEDGEHILGGGNALNRARNTENRTACSISFTTQGVLSGQNLFSSYLMRNTHSAYSSLLIWSTCVMTTIRGRPKIVAS